MGDNKVSRISGARKRVTVTGAGVEINGSGHSITCTNPGTTSVRVNGCGNECTVTSGNPRITVHGTGHTVRTTNRTGARDIIVSGTNNSILIDRNVHDIEVSGADAKVRIRGNAGQIRVNGTGAKLCIFGNVGSITLVGQKHNIYVQGNCTGNIQIGEREASSTAISTRNRILLGGSVNALRVYASGYRNQVTSTRIEFIGVLGDENRVRADFTFMVNNGTKNLIGREVDCDSAYDTPDPGTHKVTTATACSGSYSVIQDGETSCNLLTNELAAGKSPTQN